MRADFIVPLLRAAATIRDTIIEAISSLIARRRRSFLTAAGLATGILALTATVGISSSLSAQVTSRFDELVATRVTVDGEIFSDPLLGPSAIARLAELNGVVAAGSISASSGDAIPVSAARVGGASSQLRVPVYALSVGALTATQLAVVSGRLFDDGNSLRADSVALVGVTLAEQLGITSAREPLLITVDDRRLAVLGIVEAPPQLSTDFSSAVIVPDTSERMLLPGREFSSPSAIILTDRGAADQVAREAPFAANPADPSSVLSQVPLDPRQLREGVEGDNNLLVAAMSAITLLIAGVGVSSTMYVAVIERRSEFGIRRSLGAPAVMVLGQVLLESCVLGLLGGCIGVATGTVVTTLVSLYQDWPAVMPPTIYVIGPVVGVFVGGAAGLLPAVAAARIQPIQAIRNG